MPTKSLLTATARQLLSVAAASELFVSNLYQHLSNHMQRIGRFGAAAFFARESLSERGHYLRLADYFNQRGDMVPMPAIDACSESPADIAAAFEIAYSTEVQLEADYVRWFKACDCEITRQFLLGFLEEQRKSVGEYGDLIAELDRAGTDPAALMLFDRNLAGE